MYESCFANKICTDPGFLKEVYRLHDFGMPRGIIRLECFCAPKRCREETIRLFLKDNQAMFLGAPN